MAPICHLEMMGESLCVPNSTQSSQADKPTPCAPVFPRLLQNLEKFRTPPPYLPAFISEQGNDGRLCGTET